jgi:hypothetical protein
MGDMGDIYAGYTEGYHVTQGEELKERTLSG